MSGCTKAVGLLCGMLLMFVASGCLCPNLCKKRTVEAPCPVVQAPPAVPQYVEPPPAPQPPPPPPAPVLPPPVAKSIEDLSVRYPRLFQLH